MRQSMLAQNVRSGPRAFTASRKSVVSMARKFSHAKVLESISQDQIKPDFRPVRIGDTVKLGLAVQEAKGKTRTQTVDGVIIGESSSGVSKTVRFRRVFQGVGIELTLPVNAPVVQSLDFQSSGKVRRAKLYYLRQRIGKSAKLKEKVLETARRRGEIKAEAVAVKAAAAEAKAEAAAAAAAAAAEAPAEGAKPAEA